MKISIFLCVIGGLIVIAELVIAVHFIIKFW